MYVILTDLIILAACFPVVRLRGEDARRTSAMTPRREARGGGNNMDWTGLARMCASFLCFAEFVKLKAVFV